MSATEGKEAPAKKKAASKKSASKPAESAEPESTESCTSTCDIVKKHMIMAGAAGIVPMPLVDIAAVTGVQINMIRELSNHYEVPFKENRAKGIVTSLIGSLGASVVARGLVSSLVKSIPAIGTVGGVIAMPIVSSATTYAVGRIFIEHFESGGTLMDFDCDKMKDFFQKQYKEGQKLASDMKADILARTRKDGEEKADEKSA